MTRTRRRRYLQLSGGAITGLLAGCASGGEEEPPDSGGGENRSTPDEPGDPATEETSTVNPTVGAHYYLWYGTGTHNDWVREAPEQPVLGDYDARDPAVIDQHIDWCLEYGIDWLSVTWWGANSAEDVTLRDHFLKRSLAADLSFSILYETFGQLTERSGGGIDMDRTDNRTQLRDDLRYLEETYFGEPNYRRIDGRPVVYVYDAGALHGDVEDAIATARDALDGDVYLIADLVSWRDPSARLAGHLRAFDAASPYTMHDPREDIEENFVDRALGWYDRWLPAFETYDVDFLPVVIPGYDDTELIHDPRDNPVLEASPERFQSFCEGAWPYMTEGVDSVLVTSFNEWYENTQIEPSDRFGTTYLDVIQDAFNAGPISYARSDLTALELEFDRTVSEGDLSSDVTDGRELAIGCHRIDVLGGGDDPSVRYDIGGDSEPRYGGGVYGAESIAGNSGFDETFRWFGGDKGRSTLFLDGIEAEGVQGIRLRAYAAEGTVPVTVRFGESTASVSVTGRKAGQYTVTLENAT